MCLGIPGRVIEIPAGQLDLAMVEVSGVRRMINVSLIDDAPVAPGDWVLIHVGFAMARIDEAEATSTLEFLASVGQAYADEVAALKSSAIE